MTTTHARLLGMSMYSQLLAASLAACGDGSAGGNDGREEPSAALERELADCRRRLARAGAAGPDAPGDLARQIDYDSALIRLCRLHGIDGGPADFTRPLIERRRLEEALGALGVGAGAASDGRGQDPPDGSSRS